MDSHSLWNAFSEIHMRYDIWKFGHYFGCFFLTRTHKIWNVLWIFIQLFLGVSRLFHVTFLFCPCRSSLFLSPRFSSVRSIQYSVVPPFSPAYVAVPRPSRPVVSRRRIPKAKPASRDVDQVRPRSSRTANAALQRYTSGRPCVRHQVLLQCRRYSLVRCQSTPPPTFTYRCDSTQSLGKFIQVGCFLTSRYPNTNILLDHYRYLDELISTLH